MKKITKIAHLADIHLRKVPTRNEEYVAVFERLIQSLKKEKPDRIVIVGDLVNDYLELDGDQLIIAHNLLHSLAEIAPVRLTRGNHDCLKTNNKRTDSVKAIVKTLRNPDVIYYDETGFHIDENICWVVWHHGDKDNDPWKSREGKKILKEKPSKSEITYIDLFHDPINGCKSDTGLNMNSKKYFKLSDFKGDYLLAGDIHKKQYLNKEKTKAYSGSLIAQKFSEGDDNFHGYLLWDIEGGDVSEFPIDNDHSYKNIILTSFTDFDDLDFEIENPTKFMKVRFLWKTLPSTRTKENERKVVSYIKKKYEDITISHKNEFITEDAIDENVVESVENINDKGVQQEIFKDYLTKIGVDEKMIKDIIILDDEIDDVIKEFVDDSVEWDVVKFGGNNFMSYEKFDIDWRDMEGIFQIVGVNTAGKTTLVYKFLPYMLYGKTLETETRMKFGDIRFINNRNNAEYCDGYLVLEVNGEYFGIKKKTTIERNKADEIKGVSTSVNYYHLNNPDDELNDDNDINSLDEERRKKTEKKLQSVIGSYDNFMRTVLTTSDTLNRVLPKEMAVFIDSLLYESGLDVFDKKMEGLKNYEKKVNELGRIVCNVEGAKLRNEEISLEIKNINTEITNLTNDDLAKINNSITTGQNYVEEQTKKLHKIDDEIYNLDVESVKSDISQNEKVINNTNDKITKLKNSLKELKETYDVERLKFLEEEKASHKEKEFDYKIKIRDCEQNKAQESHKIEIINGEILNLKNDGNRLKNEILGLRENKKCDRCGQELTDEHKQHIAENIQELEKQMFEIADKIKEKQEKIVEHNAEIKKQDGLIVEHQTKINEMNVEVEKYLVEIGDIINDKNDVEKRKEVELELKQLPLEIKEKELENKELNEKIKKHNESQTQIKENQKTEDVIARAKERLKTLEADKTNLLDKINDKKNLIKEKQRAIDLNNENITKYLEQEYRDEVISQYRKCIHRDGVPRQLLINSVIPKTNSILENLLYESPFNIWLDIDDLRLKLSYNHLPDSIIDCLGASGKERTFASIVLKFALNQNNVKSRPKIFLLDEIMGKLDEKSVEEFVEILHIVKSHMKRVLIVEHTHQINPDYIIDVFMDDNGISHATIK